MTLQNVGNTQPTRWLANYILICCHCRTRLISKSPHSIQIKLVVTLHWARHQNMFLPAVAPRIYSDDEVEELKHGKRSCSTYSGQLPTGCIRCKPAHPNLPNNPAPTSERLAICSELRWLQRIRLMVRGCNVSNRRTAQQATRKIGLLSRFGSFGDACRDLGDSTPADRKSCFRKVCFAPTSRHCVTASLCQLRPDFLL